MDAFQLIALLQRKMQDPVFAQKFNVISDELNRVPGLQQKVMQIFQIQDDKQRERELNKLPTKVKKLVKELFSLLR